MTLPDQTKAALTYLLQTAASEGVTVAGFAFAADPPAITSFGNCPDHGDIKLYELLCGMSRQKQAAGSGHLRNGAEAGMTGRKALQIALIVTLPVWCVPAALYALGLLIAEVCGELADYIRALFTK